MKAAVSVPVSRFANGNILTHADIARCLAATSADAVMSAEGQLCALRGGGEGWHAAPATRGPRARVPRHRRAPEQPPRTRAPSRAPLQALRPPLPRARHARDLKSQVIFTYCDTFVIARDKTYHAANPKLMKIALECQVCR
jgi:Dihydrouridine synthase (Dus)